MNLKDLKAPLRPSEIEWRVLQKNDCGYSEKTKKIWIRPIPYIDKTAVLNILDRVCGPENWKTETIPIIANPELSEKAIDKLVKAGLDPTAVQSVVGFRCTLSIKIGDQWVSKTDVGAATDYESLKGGASDALKRAAKQWGIGRYLDKIMNMPGINPFCTEVLTQRPSNMEGYCRAYIQDPRPGGSRKISMYYKPPILPDDKARQIIEVGLDPTKADLQTVSTTSPTDDEGTTSEESGEEKRTSEKSTPRKQRATKAAPKEKEPSVKEESPPAEEDNESQIAANLQATMDALGTKADAASIAPLVTGCFDGKITTVRGLKTVEQSQQLLHYVTALLHCKKVAKYKKMSELKFDVGMWSPDGTHTKVDDLNHKNIDAFVTWIDQEYATDN